MNYRRSGRDILLPLFFMTLFMAMAGEVSLCHGRADAADAAGLDGSGEMRWAANRATEQDDFFAEDNWSAEAGMSGGAAMADPLEPLNRFFFQFNDKLYFWLLKPVSKIYGRLLAKEIRSSFRNAFDNLLAPVRVANNLLQGKFRGAGVETVRFVVNSTVGIYGLADAARKEFDLAPHDEDLGQTFGVYGVGPGFYINWPVLGPSSLRDSLGQAGDAFLEPFAYLSGDQAVAAAAFGVKKINQISLTPGDYELFVDTALDPYAAVRDAYQQYRQGKVGNSTAK